MMGIDPNPDNLKIKPWERQFMRQLNALIPSPRLTKRLVNVYCLIRAMVKNNELQQFVGTESRGGEYQPAMVLLAILTGFPDQAYDIFTVLLNGEVRYRKRRVDTWWNFVEKLKPTPISTRATEQLYENVVKADIRQEEVAGWERLHHALLAQKPHFSTEDSVEPFIRMALRVSRFSFQSGRVISTTTRRT